MRPGVNINPITLLANLPVSSSAGACIAGDPRGDLVAPYLYYFVPTSTTACQFWRFDTRGNGMWQRLRDPVQGGTNRFGAGCALIVDASAPTPLGAPGVANAWLFHPASAGPFAQFQYYTAETDVWAIASQAGAPFTDVGLGAAALAAQWTSDASLAHPCIALNPTVSDNFLYLSGNAATFFYRYAITTGTVAAMLAHGLAASTGTAMAWLPARQDRIYYIRGGGATTMEYYSVVGNNWTAITQIPATASFNTGTGMIADRNRDRAVIFSENKLHDFDGTNITPISSLYGNDGTVHVGSLAGVLAVGGNKYVYVGKHTHSDFQRVQILE